MEGQSGGTRTTSCSRNITKKRPKSGGNGEDENDCGVDDETDDTGSNDCEAGETALPTSQQQQQQCSISISSSIPIRDYQDLFAPVATVNCATRNLCRSCAYKVGAFDVAQDVEFCRTVPNVRPELCPRAMSSASSSTNSIATGSRRRSDASVRAVIDDNAWNSRNSPKSGAGNKLLRVLTVGDGDFTFSLALTRRNYDVTATSYEAKETVCTVYAETGIERTLQELELCRNAAVLYQVDGTQLSSLEKMLQPTAGAAVLFDRIVWNFPCSAVGRGQDGQNQEMEHNKELIRKFVQSAVPLLSEHGQIHMNHKTKPPFNQWKIQDVVMTEPCPGRSRLLRYLGRVVLDRCLFPPYTPRKALDRKSFPCHDACTYVFDRCCSTNLGSESDNGKSDKDLHQHASVGNPLVERTIFTPSSSSSRGQCHSTIIKNTTMDEGRVLLAEQEEDPLVRVTPELILTLRTLHLEQQHGTTKKLQSRKTRNGKRLRKAGRK
jgi:Domain of unknown function (DUF2431)